MEVKTLTDVIKFVNEYWDYSRFEGIFGTDVTYFPPNNFTSTGDYE